MSWLVIGVGNPLRRDDGLGPWLAERISERRLPGVTVRSVHQLTPELAAEMASFDRVLFLDASRTDDEPQAIPLTPSDSVNRMGHAFSPGDLLALAERMNACRPQAWLVIAGGRDFGFGEGLSPDAEKTGTRALEVVAELWDKLPACPD